ncbi:unnamed protein product [Caenorhabditis angaria]|uniref:Uncharacterized protein n=1 Tax=Caenorhabditis angaria TaxID=860376 RepID=A0A9P1MTN3_9PELO|nr:unnamed protein product [Caenorhabditis angaria]
MKALPKTRRLVENYIRKLGEIYREVLINRQDAFICRAHLKKPKLNMRRVREEVYEEPQKEKVAEAGAEVETEVEAEPQEDLVPLIPNIKREQEDFRRFEIASGSGNFMPNYPGAEIPPIVNPFQEYDFPSQFQNQSEQPFPNYPGAEIPPMFEQPVYPQFQDQSEQLFINFLNQSQNSEPSSSYFQFPELQNNFPDSNFQQQHNFGG